MRFVFCSVNECYTSVFGLFRARTRMIYTVFTALFCKIVLVIKDNAVMCVFRNLALWLRQKPLSFAKTVAQIIQNGLENAAHVANGIP